MSNQPDRAKVWNEWNLKVHTAEKFQENPLLTNTGEFGGGHGSKKGKKDLA